MTFVYNDMKREDILNNIDKIRNYDFIVNNTTLTAEDVEQLLVAGCSIYYCVKLFESNYRDQIINAHELGFTKIAIDAENYNNNIKYTKELGNEIRMTCMLFDEVILLPEDLGGERYKNYPTFTKALQPHAVLMERTYQQPEPWNIFTLFLRNIYLWLYKINIYIGIWPEMVDTRWRKIQYDWAKKISGDKVFWYSETKTLPGVNNE